MDRKRGAAVIYPICFSKVSAVMPSRPATAAALVCTAVAAVTACVASAKDEGAGQGSGQPGVSVQTTVISTAPFTRTVDAIGVVMPRPGHVAVLSAPIPARVAQVYVVEGQEVKKGNRLVELEQAAFQASTESADAALEAATRAYDRAQRLFAAGVAPRKNVEQATADLARARADAVNARRSQQLSVLRSPFDGVVTSMTAVLGSAVDANQPLVEVTDLSALDIVLNLTPADAARIQRGATVVFRAGQVPLGEPLGDGTIADIGGAVDSATRSVPVRAHPRTLLRALRVGETIFGQVTVATTGDALAVPVAALVPEGEGFTVFVVDSQGIAHQRQVTVGDRSDSLAEITRGLTAGERVVTQGAYGLVDSSRVTSATR
jgi:membrane fusion protein (multidrug efflux system)